MGPRLFSRGNGIEVNLCRRQSDVLQWGHDFSAVEMPLLQPRSTHGWMLQWGHDFSAVEIEMMRLQGRLMFKASMGPRLFSRGNHILQVDLSFQAV